jgi:transcriptional regulator with XRE-family HTH domain
MQKAQTNAANAALGTEIQQARLAARVPLAAAAKAAKISRADFTAFETGKRTPDAFQINRIAAALNTSVEALIDAARARKNPARLPGDKMSGCKTKTA